MRKGTSKASSAKAATRAGADVGVGFGGFLGGQSLMSAAAGNPASDYSAGPPASGDVAADVAQHLKRLTKREAVTRVKALQALRELLQEQGDESVAGVLPQWAHVFPRLVLDNDRGVRQAAADLMHLLAQRAKRKLAPFLRVLLPSWWLACSDMHPDTASAAQAAMQAAFPGTKQREAILFCRVEVVSLLEDNLKATQEQLGDAARESTDELAQRHERVTAATLLALAALADTAAPADATAAADALPSSGVSASGAAEGQGGASRTAGAAASPDQQPVPEAQLLQRVAAIVDGSGFWKRLYASKSPMVRQAAYTFTARLAARHPQMLAASLAASAPAVLSAVAEKHTPNHGAMWEALLIYCRHFPAAWDCVDVAKVVLPRLTSFLSHACYGSFEASHPALLPFLSCMPQRLAAAAPRQLAAIASALWQGCELLTAPAQRATAATCYQECYCFLLSRAAAVEAADNAVAAPEVGAADSPASSAGSSATQLLHAALCQGPVETALLPGSPGLAAMGAEAAAAVLTQLGGRAQAPGADGSSDASLRQLLQAIGASIADNLRHGLQSAGSEAGAACKVAAALLSRLAEAGGGAHRQLVAQCVVPPVAAQVLPSSSQGDHVASASRLLATIVQLFGADSVPSSSAGAAPGAAAAHSGTLHPTAIVDRVLAGGAAEAGNASLEAQADLLAACLAQQADPAAACGAALLQLAGIEPAVADGERQAHGLHVASLLANRLWPQPPSAAVSAGRRSVSFAGTATPTGSSRMAGSSSTAASKTQADPLLWWSEALDRLAAALAAPGVLGRQPSAPPLLGRLLAGLGPLPLVGEAAALAALDTLHQMLAAATSPATGKDTVEAAIGALHALDCCLYSVALGASPQLAARRALLLCSVVQLTWHVEDATAAQQSAQPQPAAAAATAHSSANGDADEAGGRNDASMDGDADSSAGSSDGENDAAASAAAVQVQLAALSRQLWAQGQRTAELVQRVAADDAAAVTAGLTDCLRRGIDTSIAASAQGADWAGGWALRVAELHGAIHAAPPAASRLVDAVLAPRPGWPRYATVSSAGGRAGQQQQDPDAAGSQADGPAGLSDAAAAMDALAAALASQLGAAAVFTPSDATKRVWLLEDLLCSSHSQTRSAGAAPAGTSQAGQVLAAAVQQLDAQPAQELLDGLLVRLWDSCAAGTSEELSTYAAATSATLQQLSLLSRQHGSAATALCQLAARRLQRRPVGSQLPADLLCQFVSILASFAREDPTGQRLEASGLADYAAAACAAAAALPPAAVCAAESRPQTGAALDALRLAVACWPARGDEASGGDADGTAASSGTAGDTPDGSSSGAAPASAADERAALLALLRRQLEWDAVCKRTQAGLSTACVELENVAEVVSSAAVNAAGAAASSAPEGAEAAVLLLHQLGRMRLVDPPPGPFVAAAVRDAGRADALRDRHQDHAQIFALLAAKFEGEARPTDVPSSWPELAAEGAADVLRMLFAGATVQALAAAAGPEAAAAAAAWQAACTPLWTAVADAAHLAAQQPPGGNLGAAVMPAVEAADSWAAETGVDAVGGLLALVVARAAPVPRLQAAALQVLLARGGDLVARLTTAPLISEEDAQMAEEALEAADSSSGPQDAVLRLVTAGVRPALAAALLAAPAAGDDDGGGAGRWVVAAGLVAGHLMGLPPGSAGRRLLAQTLRDVHSLVPGLLDALVERLPLQWAAPSAAQRRRSGQGAASRTSPTESATSVQEWRYLDELRAAGDGDAAALAATAYRGLLLALPASTALWFGDLRDRGTAAAVESYTREQHSPVLLAHELAIIQSPAARELADADAFSLKANPAMREVVAVAQVEDGAVLELAIRLPPAWPLKPADVECRRKVGVSEGRLRKWLLSISAFLRNQNGSILDAMSLWKANVDQTFQGVEECLICYSIVHPANGQLPKMPCRTCAKCFHAACLYKWFQSSAKSTCPHCQSPWLHGAR